ncbi:bifunctional folylpolyglutamate synthase/dihydrofolate synthase [Desulfobotulus mexicanus]|uniref:Dihydrofolate synthase/folylpolyglutamate synthase n=1 Tax=Desulfobotulus mexicanus TaxID=2586642 RepID=A0A5Q4VDM9_9BACT|nr:folylpolyglutamate synthase/dihydrofolate synthase family protein [Desulfobotulus mexicanus]TYT75735.1 bifunctional folylpolyglutamate synthase/dihydrofolate synthase [Desulfobotulus mexicanus]
MTLQEPDFSHLYHRQRMGIRPGLEGIQKLLHTMGNPQNRFPAIHVAGTNGKGSTASLAASILQAAGLQTGLYTSPHLIHFGERFQINGQNPSPALLKKLVTSIEEKEDRENPATFFEFTTAMAFLLFAEALVDMAVLETGMGGRWDATNVCRPAVCIITSIGMDHREFLGHTTAAIAGEKAGIIKQGVPVITGVKQPEALDVIMQKAKACNCPIKIMGRDFHIENTGQDLFTYRGRRTYTNLNPGLAGNHQATNMALAIAALETLVERGIIASDIPQAIIHKGLADRSWPARIQQLSTNPAVILDGAHNTEAAMALAEYIRERTPEPRILVFGVLEDKDAKAMLDLLTPLFDRIILTRPDTPRSLDPEKLAPILPKTMPFEICPPVSHALETAMNLSKKTGCICIAGSLYLAGEVLAIKSHKT